MLQVSTILDNVKNTNEICGSQRWYTKCKQLRQVHTQSVKEHAWKRCPAREAKCYKCQKTIHFSSQCHLRQASAITEIKDSDNEDQFLGAVTSDSLTHGMSKLR